MAGDPPRWEGRVLAANTDAFFPSAEQAEREEDRQWRRERRFWWAWVLGTTLAWGAATAGIVLAFKAVPAVRLLYLAAGLVQSRALRGFLPQPIWWAVATAAGTALAVGLHVALFAGPAPLWASASRPVRDATITFVDLALIALCQWLWLRRHVPCAGWWLPVTLVPAALLALVSLADTSQSEATAASVSRAGLLLVATALVVGFLITAPQASVLVRLLRQRGADLPGVGQEDPDARAARSSAATAPTA